MYRRFLLVAIVGAFVAFPETFVEADPASSPGSYDEHVTHVVIQRLTAASLEMAHISVSCTDGVVVLNGKVASIAQKKKAEEIARHVGGVKSVKDNIGVAP